MWGGSRGAVGARNSAELSRTRAAPGLTGPSLCPARPRRPLQDIERILPVHNLGALSLDSQPLKYSLRAEAANWKAHFSRNIHKQAAADLMVRAGAGQGAPAAGGGRPAARPAAPTLLRRRHPRPCRHLSASPQAFDQYLRELTARLGRRVEDLDDVRAVVAALREVRRRGGAAGCSAEQRSPPLCLQHA